MKPTQSAIEDLANKGQEQWLEVVQQQVGSLRFGVVQVVVHESRVVQIEKTEKIRFESSAESR